MFACIYCVEVLWGGVFAYRNMFSVAEEPSAEDKKRLSERAQRFGKQGTAEGNMSVKKKMSIDELLKRTLVSTVCAHVCII